MSDKYQRCTYKLRVSYSALPAQHVSEIGMLGFSGCWA